MPSLNVVRLMSWRPFKSRSKHPRPEQDLCIEFANRLRALELDGRTSCVWTHVPNEIGWNRNKVAQTIYAAAKAMGMIVGTADYLFLAADGSLALEAKSKSGTQHDGQKDFEKWCGEKGVPYAVFRTVEEGIEILRQHGMVT